METDPCLVIGRCITAEPAASSGRIEASDGAAHKAGQTVSPGSALATLSAIAVPRSSLR